MRLKSLLVAGLRRECLHRAAAFALLGLAVTIAVPHVGHAAPNVSDAYAFEVNRPSHPTPRALTGLFTSVARAGNRMVAVGERGRIILSDDNGATWRQIQTPTSVTLAHVTFATPTDGWAVGGMGIVLHTTDAGLTWTKQFDGVQAANNALDAANADVKQFGTNNSTTAGLQAAQAMIAGGPTVPFLDVFATSANDLIIAGAFGMAFSSADAGASWKSLADSLPNPNGLHIYQIMQDGDNLAVVGEQGLILYGPPAKPLATITTSFQGTLFGETLAADHSWIVFGLQGTVMRSTDHGAHWAIIPAGQPVGIDCGMTLANGTLLLGNVAGQLLYSHDNGQTFAVSTVNEPVVGLSQATDGSIIAVGPSGPRRISLASLAAGA